MDLFTFSSKKDFMCSAVFFVVTWGFFKDSSRKQANRLETVNFESLKFRLLFFDLSSNMNTFILPLSHLSQFPEWYNRDSVSTFKHPEAF